MCMYDDNYLSQEETARLSWIYILDLKNRKLFNILGRYCREKLNNVCMNIRFIMYAVIKKIHCKVILSNYT